MRIYAEKEGTIIDEQRREVLRMIGCLMIHGYTGGPYEVEPLASYLEKETNWDVFVPTLPGHGRNLNLKDVTHTNWIDAVEEAMGVLTDKYDEIYLIGFSMGGMLAAYLAGKYHVDKLVLLSTAGRYLSFKQMTLDIGMVISDGFKGKLKENILYTHYKKKIGKIPFKANLEFLKLIRFTRSYLKDIESPVFIAQGQQDGMVPARTINYLDKEISSKHKEIVLFEKSKHLICLGEDKDTLNAMVKAFLENEK